MEAKDNVSAPFHLHELSIFKPLVDAFSNSALSSSSLPGSPHEHFASNSNLFMSGSAPRSVWVRSGLGATMNVSSTDTSTQPLIDLSSMTSNTILGINDPWVKLKQIEFLMSSHPHYVTIRMGFDLYYRVAHRILARFTPAGDYVLNHRSCNGSDAVELAIHAAWKAAVNDPCGSNRRKLGTFRGSYHGQCLTACLVSEHQPARFMIAQPDNVHFFPTPSCLPDSTELSPDALLTLDVLEKDGAEYFAVVLEPIQCRNGVHVIPHAFLRKLKDVCARKNICLIFDESQSCFGFIGTITFAEATGIYPDICVLSKGVTSGHGALALVVAHRKYRALDGTFSGKTNTGDVLSLVAVDAVLDRLLGVDESSAAIPSWLPSSFSTELRKGLLAERYASTVALLDRLLVKLGVYFGKHAGTPRGIGLLRGLPFLAYEKHKEGLCPSPRLAALFCEESLKHNVYVRQVEDCFLLKPCLVISENEMEVAFGALCKTFDAIMSREVNPENVPKSPGQGLAAQLRVQSPFCRSSRVRGVAFVIGCPGAGKSSVCVAIALRYNLAHIVVGELLHNAASTEPNSELGRLILTTISRGEIVPGKITVDLLIQELQHIKYNQCKGFLLDGFPRRLDQAIDFCERVTSPKGVLLIDGSEEVLTQRVLCRQREDDNKATIGRRFADYREQTIAVAERFSKALWRIDACQSRDALLYDVEATLRSIGLLSSAAPIKSQVRLWVGRDVPAKHFARMIRLRAMNPHISIVFYSLLDYLYPFERCKLVTFCQQLRITLKDIRSLRAHDEDEQIILDHVMRELNAYVRYSGTLFAGNLSVVSDGIRLLSSVIDQGLFADLDVEFMNAFTQSKACSLYGIVARIKSSGIVSNDAIAGIGVSVGFRVARRQLASFYSTYQQAVCDYFQIKGIAYDAKSVQTHERFFELRNLDGVQKFSLCGGPQNLAIALFECGIQFPSSVDHVESGDFTAGNPLVLGQPPLRPDLHLNYQEVKLLDAKKNVSKGCQSWFGLSSHFPVAVSRWDHSWLPGCAWRSLSVREEILLHLVLHHKWSTSQAVLNIAYGISRDLLAPLRCFSWPLFAFPRLRKILTRSELSPEVLSFVEENETPSPQFRLELGLSLQKSSPHLLQSAQALVQDGVTRIDNVLDPHLLSRLRAAFEAEITKKQSSAESASPLLRQTAFNIAVDVVEPEMLALINCLVTNRTLVQLVEYHLGGPSLFIAARGYRQLPRPCLRYRAWEYHQDMKTKGPFGEVKVMVLLTDLLPCGQAMRYLTGTHKYHWSSDTQAGTKFTLDEALALAQPPNSLYLCHGPAGTCWAFDTNGIHSGHRGLASTRDVMTLAFTRLTPSSHTMFEPKLLSDVSLARVSEVSMKNFFPSDPVSLSLHCDVCTACLEPESKLDYGLPLGREGLDCIRRLYLQTPEMHDIKLRLPRNYRRNGYATLSDALRLLVIAQSDLNADIDVRLSAWPGLDKSRDNAIVYIRDQPASSPQYVYFMKTLLLSTLCPRLRKDRIPKIAFRISQMDLFSVTPEKVHGAVSACQRLLRDLSVAAAHCDSFQRERSTALFVTFCLYWIIDLLPISCLATNGACVCNLCNLRGKIERMYRDCFECYEELVVLEDRKIWV